jgi:molybdopterin-containing oxidoreductase family membrane subunit
MSRQKGGLVGVFQSLDSILSAVRRIKESGIRAEKVYSPARTEEITDLMEKKPSPVRYFTLTGGITGILFGYWLATHAALKWNFIVWGKQAVVIVPYVIVSFEFCILFAVFATLLGIAVHTRLPRLRLPEDYDPRFSRDHYGVVIYCGEEDKARIREMLFQSGAVEVREIPEVGWQGE